MNDDTGSLVVIGFYVVILSLVVGYYLWRDHKRKRQMLQAAEGLGGRRVRKFLKGGCVEFPVADGRSCLMWVQEKSKYTSEKMFLEQDHRLPFQFSIEAKGSIFGRDVLGAVGLGKKKINLPPSLADRLIIHSSDPVNAEFHFNDPKRQEAAMGLISNGFIRVDAGKKKIKGHLDKFRDNDFDPARLKQFGEWLCQLVG
jgi:hypothetical protein